MNTFKVFAAAVLISAGALAGLTSFTSGNSIPAESKAGNVSFQIINNSEAEWPYCADGGHHTIATGTTKTIDYREGTELRYLEKGNCAAIWLKVTRAHNGQTLKLTDLMN